jgi:hypothetical protein
MFDKLIRPIEVPEEAIEELVKSLNIDTATAADLLVLLHDELRRREKRS